MIFGLGSSHVHAPAYRILQKISHSTFPTNNFFYTTDKGTINTDHSNNPVPLVIIANAYKGKALQLPKGVMSDLAPTLLYLMGLPKPAEMIGRNLMALTSGQA